MYHFEYYLGIILFATFLSSSLLISFFHLFSASKKEMALFDFTHFQHSLSSFTHTMIYSICAAFGLVGYGWCCKQIFPIFFEKSIYLSNGCLALVYIILSSLACNLAYTIICSFLKEQSKLSDLEKQLIWLLMSLVYAIYCIYSFNLDYALFYLMIILTYFFPIAFSFKGFWNTISTFKSIEREKLYFVIQFPLFFIFLDRYNTLLEEILFLIGYLLGIFVFHYLKKSC